MPTSPLPAAAGPAPEPFPTPRPAQETPAAPQSYTEKYAGTQLAPTALAAPASSASPGSAESMRQTALLAGIAWLIAAGLVGYLGVQQIQLGSIVGSNMSANGAWNLVSALITVVFGVRLLTRPTRGSLSWSVFWAVVSVAWQGYQIANGIGDAAFIGATVVMAIAGVLSLVAWSNGPRQTAPVAPVAPVGLMGRPLTPVSPPGAAAVSPAVASASPSASRRWGAPEIIVGIIIATVVIGGAVVLLTRNGQPSPTGTGNASDYPPTGDIWFGTSYAPGSLVLSGQTESGKAGTTMVAVANLSRPSSLVTLEVALPSGELPIAAGSGNADSNIYAFNVSLVLMSDPGSYAFTVVDQGNNVLASGNLSVSP